MLHSVLSSEFERDSFDILINSSYVFTHDSSTGYEFSLQAVPYTEYPAEKAHNATVTEGMTFHF
jgi:hypothetical protein